MPVKDANERAKMITTCLSIEKMNVQDIISITSGRIVCGEDKLNREVHYAFASDLMSDVLTLKEENVLLITGLASIQTIRTAEIADIHTIVFVRNKKATKEVIDLANQAGIVLIECPSSMFRTAGLLYKTGLNPVY